MIAIIDSLVGCALVSSFCLVLCRLFVCLILDQRLPRVVHNRLPSPVCVMPYQCSSLSPPPALLIVVKPVASRDSFNCSLFLSFLCLCVFGSSYDSLSMSAASWFIQLVVFSNGYRCFCRSMVHAFVCLYSQHPPPLFT